MRKWLGIWAVALGAAVSSRGLAGIAPLTPASVLLRVGDPAVSGTANETIDSFYSIDLNHSGGWAAVVSNRSGSNFRSEIVGSLGGGPAGLFRWQSTLGIYEQQRFTGHFALGDDGSLLYAAQSRHNGTGATNVDNLWLDDALLADERAPVPGIPDRYYHAFIGMSLDAQNRPGYVAELRDAPGGPQINRALLRGDGSEVLFNGGDMIGGLNLPSAAMAFALDNSLSVSRQGSNWMSAVYVDETNGGYNVPVINGAAVMAGGEYIVSDHAPAAALGARGEYWGGFRSFHVADSGDYLLGGNTGIGEGKGSTTFGFLMRNGLLVMQDGDSIVTEFGIGSLEGIGGTTAMNEDGDWAAIAYVNIAEEYRQVLLVNGQPVSVSGQTVDWDGDGMLDSGAMLAGFRISTIGDNQLQLSERDANGQVCAWFVAEVQLPGGRSLSVGLANQTVAIPEPAALTLLMAMMALARRRQRGRA